tara:strand:+ start:12751 stop:23460 length:10710 start_codon:yes stop_codon:yes gene_type:complete
MISEKEALEIIQWGKTQGYSEQQSIDLVNRRDHELRVEAERRRIRRLRREAEKKRKELEKQLMENVQTNLDTKKRVFTLPKFDHQKDDGTGEQYEYTYENGEWYFNQEQVNKKGKVRVRDLSDKVADKLNKKYIEDNDRSNIKDFDKITSLEATWTGPDGEPKKLKDNLLDYRDDDFVANTLNREYGDDFEFFDSGNDMITARSKSTGEEYEFETNFVGGGGKKEIASGMGLVEWMKDQKFGDMHWESIADYRAIKNDDGELEWRYVNSDGDDIGKVESTSVLDELNTKYPNELNEFKRRLGGENDFKPIDGTWHYRNANGEFVEAPSDIQNEMTTIYGQASELPDDGKIYEHGLVPLEIIENKNTIENEYERVSNMSLDDYYKNIWYPQNYTDGFSFKNVMQNAKFLTDLKEGNIFSREFGTSEVVKEDFEAYKNKYKVALDNSNKILEEEETAKVKYPEVVTLNDEYLDLQIKYFESDRLINTDTDDGSFQESDKARMLEVQPEWTKFYDDSSFEGWEDLDLNDFNEYVKDQVENGLFKNLEITTFANVSTEENEDGAESAQLKFDRDKGKWFWSGGGGEYDFDIESEEGLGGIRTIDRLKSQVLTNYLNEKISKNMEQVDIYDQAGVFDNLNLLDEYSQNVAKLDELSKPLVEEYEKLKNDIDNGTVKNSQENINKLNDLITTINTYSNAADTYIESYNNIANDETFKILSNNYKGLINRTATLSKNFTTLTTRDTDIISRIAGADYRERLAEQERLIKAERGHLGWQSASIAEGLWSTFVNGVSGVAGLMEAYVPELWSDTDPKTKSQIMNKYSMIAENLTFDAVANGEMIDPETGDLNWSAVPSQVAPIVLDMYLMTQSGGALGATKTALVGGTRRVVSKTGQALNLTNKTLPKFMSTSSTIKRRIGKISDKLDLVNRGNQFTGGMMIMLPKNIQESVLQVDEDFTYEDALKSAMYKTVTESAIEMFNPDVRFIKGMNKFKNSAGFGNMRNWNPNLKGFADNGKKMLDIFYQNLKNVPQELIEENLQETANMLWNGYYNKNNNTDFHIPTAEDYKALNVLTPLSVLTAGFIRTRGFRNNKPNAAMYQAAIENLDEFKSEMLKEVERFRTTDGTRGLDPKDYSNIMRDLDAFVAIKNKIDIDEYNDMTIAERTDMLSLMYTQEELIKKINEEKDPKRKTKLEKDLKNIKIDLQKVANSVSTGVTTRQQDLLELEILKKKAQWKRSERNSEQRKKLKKEIAKDLKKRNELRENAAKFQFNGKSYNSAKSFLDAITKAEQNGYFDNVNNRPNIRIGNKVSTQMTEYLVNKIENLTGSERFNKSEVLMKSNDAIEAEEFISKKENVGKTIEQYQQELDQEQDKAAVDVNKLNDLRNAIKYLDLQNRGYQNNKFAGGMVMQGRQNKAVMDINQQRFQDRVDAVKKITDEAGLQTIIWNADTIKSQEGAGIPRGAHRQNAFIAETRNPETGKIEPVIVLNSTVALNKKSFTAVTHELLHILLFSTFNGPVRVVDGYKVRITQKGVDLIKGFLDLLTPDQKRKLENELEIRGYKHEENPDGSINRNKPLPFEAYAEEYINHYHDLVVNETDPNRRIPLNEADTRGVLKRIGDYFKSFFVQETNESLGSILDGNLDTPQQVLDFMREFNRQAIQNNFDEKLIERAVQSKDFYGDIAMEEDESLTPYSRAEQDFEKDFTQQERTDLAAKTNEIYSDPNLTLDEKAFAIAESYGGMAVKRINIAKNNAPGQVKDLFDIYRDDMIAQLTYDPGDPDTKSRNVLGLVKDYPAYVAKQEEAGLKVAPLSGYINRWFKVRAYEVFKELTKDKGFKKAMDDAMNEVSQMEAQESQQRTESQIKSGRIIISDRIINEDPTNKGKINRINNYNQNITNQVNQNPKIYEGKTYKTLKDLDVRGTVSIMMFDPNAVYVDDGSPVWRRPKMQKLLGTSILDSIVKKIKNNDNLNQQDIKALQMFVSKHKETLWAGMPQGFMTNEKGRPTTATGVQKVLLEPFYDKGKRTGNLTPQRKKASRPNNFLEVFGITPTGEVNIVGKESNVSQRVKALVDQFGKTMTNQQVRKTLFDNGADPEVINRIANGKSVMVYSRDIAQGDVNPETNNIEPGFATLEAQRVSEAIRMYHTDRKSYDFLKELDPVFIGVVEDMFINPNPNLGQGLNYVPSIMLDKYTPKEFLKNNFKGKSYIGPKLFDTKRPNKIGEYQEKYVEEAVAFGLTFHPSFDFQTLKFLLGFKIGKTINPNLYESQLEQIKNRVFTQEQIQAEEQFMIENGLDPNIIGQSIKMINSSEVANMLNDISTQPNLEAKEAKLKEYRSRLQEINKANENAMKYISLKMKQAYNDSKIISPHFVYFNGQIQTNIIEGTRSLSTFEYMYLTNEQQVPLVKNKKGKIKLLKKPKKGKEQSNVDYYSSNAWNDYIAAWKKVGEWQERYDVNSNTVTEKEIKLAGSKKAAVEVATINDLNWKNEHVGASATTHAERTSYVFSNGKSVDLQILGHDHRSAWVPKYLADKYFDAKIKIGAKLVDNKTSYEGPMRMTKFGRGKSSNIFHVDGLKLAPYLTKIEDVSAIVENIRRLTDAQAKDDKIITKAVQLSRTINEDTPSRGMSAFDFDETLIDKGENTIIATKGNDVVEISSGNWPLDGPRYAAEGYDFDFSDFINVKGGVEGPLMQKFRNRIAKYGIENNYILTARPAEAAPAIKAWLETQGIDMPLENITGLGNSTGEAKAMWIAEKFSEGYNDIYFVDDALPNVEAVANMLDQLDIKGSSVQARINFSRDISPEFSRTIESQTSDQLDLNRIIEQTTGEQAEKRYSEAQAKVRGSKKGKWSFFVPPSAEDFKGLLYRLVGKGRIGEQHMAFFKKTLLDPFARAITNINRSTQQVQDAYRQLLKAFPDVKKDLNRKIKDFEGAENLDFTVDNAVRVYLWNKSGFEIPGLSQRDKAALVSFVNSDPELKAFADQLSTLVNQPMPYTPPSEYWLAETIQSDLQTLNNEITRDMHLAEFKQNRAKMFGEWQGDRLVGENMNKLEAIYGTRFREALEDMLYRMEYGRKREQGTNRLVNAFNNWANQSVGAIMFFNMRSALLQTISSVNFINWSDNNPLKAAMAFANQRQFWADFSMIFNSDMLKQRRAGNQRGINEAELAAAVAGSDNKAKAALNWLLTKGFLPTQIADSFAIASGGATFYRNRVNSYLKQGLTQQEAEAKAFKDFQEVTEESQQSSRPDLISQQQASPLGRYILAFKNTPMQYARLMKKAWLDIANGRGDFKTNLSKIIYYGMVQNLIFNGLQAALGALIGADDEEEESNKQERIINGMIDSVLGGLGFGGNAVVAIKNTVREYLKQKDKKWGADHTYTMLQLVGFSPTVGSKLRKIYSGIQTEKFNEDVIKEMSLLDIDNPVYSALANVISGLTNIPLDRLVKKVDNVDAAITEDITMAERLALLLGWNTWDLGIEDQDIIAVEEEIKEKKDKERKEKQERKKVEDKKIKEEENKLKEEENKKKNDGRCIAISRGGTRCKNEAVAGNYCTIHAKVEQGTVEVQCSKIKSNGERCKMKTKAKSGLCYYHD